MNLQQRKSKLFAQALDEFEKYKKELSKELSNKNLSLEEYERLIKQKAEELDL